jgi:hypothetical protein
MFDEGGSMLPLREMKFAQGAMKLTYLAIMSREGRSSFALRAMKPIL